VSGNTSSEGRVRVSGATVRWRNELGLTAFRRRWAPLVAVVESPLVLQHNVKEGKLRSGFHEGKTQGGRCSP
jgi:hypothetical protein